MTRGNFIVFEGLDRSGKTTQCTFLKEYLTSFHIESEIIRFPDRTTPVGNLCDKYLKNEIHLSDHVVHLCFSANRWEVESQIRAKLEQGITLLCDRYVFSGVAYTAAKGLDVDWCKSCDSGLPKPDKVVFLDISNEDASKRGNYGEERYEKKEFQARVKDIYKNHLNDPTYWSTIDASGSIDHVFHLIKETLFFLFEHENCRPIQTLW